MVLLLAILGISLPIILLYYNSKNYASVIYLGSFFLLLSLYGLHHYILVFSRSVPLVKTVMMHSGFLYYLLGPMLYLYVRSILTDDHRLKRLDILHLLPLLLWLVAVFPYLSVSGEYKTMAATEFIRDPSSERILEILFPKHPFTTKALFLSRPLMVLVYLTMSLILFVEYKKGNRHFRVFAGQRFMVRWLVVLFVFTGLLVSGHLLLIASALARHNMNVYITLNGMVLIGGAGLMGLLISPFFFPEVLYGLPRRPDSINMEKQEPEEPETHENGTRKTQPHFENNYLLHIGHKADACMKEYQPYLTHDFTLARLSVLINVPVHHLAYYFREIRKQGFSEYRNEWRIEHAKSLIANGEASGITLEAIGEMSGFSSRNTFLAAFKKKEGICPSSFAARVNE
jgi:AraC-like DNA-binding protein